MTKEKVQFILGGVRSGKSQFAENVATKLFYDKDTGATRLIYIATAEVFDKEMRLRIDQHKARRGPEWELCETPIELPSVIRDIDCSKTIFLVDCISIWTTNLLINKIDTDAYRNDLIQLLSKLKGQIILVSSETGLGIVPDNKLSRQFRDANGLTNQSIARSADTVFFLVAGIPQKIKARKHPASSDDTFIN